MIYPALLVPEVASLAPSSGLLIIHFPVLRKNIHVLCLITKAAVQVLCEQTSIISCHHGIHFFGGRDYGSCLFFVNST